MEHFGREFLKSGQTIRLSHRRDGAAPDLYHVQSVIGQGGSTVCYEARRERDGHVETGKLKEFYPVDAGQGGQRYFYSLERMADGQLVPGVGTMRRFDEMCEEYVRTYHELETLMAEDAGSQILKNYIQHGEVLYGMGTEDVNGSHRRGTVYIWSPGAEGQRFDGYLSEVRREPVTAADHKLYAVLQTIRTLTDCIKAMHTVGLLHLDIKPSNFLVPYDSSLNINVNRVSLFDINTLYRSGSGLPVMGGTEGYFAPEVLRGRADNRSDIYSIGAMLFNAVVILPEIADGLYRSEYFEHIPRMVRDSLLIRSSSSNSNVRLMSGLADILSRCLTVNRRQRFQSCEELLRALDKVIVPLQTYIVDPAALGPNERLAIVSTDVRGEAEPTIVIHKLLYEHPLYGRITPDKRNLDVLVIGSGTYGQKFIDIALQAAQIKDVRLNIRALSHTPEEDGGIYLQFRPELPRFVDVSVDGRPVSRVEDPYGTVEFAQLVPDGGAGYVRFSENDAETNTGIVRRILQHAPGGWDYVFIALGSDGLNRTVAALMCQQGAQCPVCYVSESGDAAQAETGMIPVNVNGEIHAENIDPDLEQMAFNTHSVWLASRNFDAKAEREKFIKDTYNYVSSLAYALSVPYKLFSIGIDVKDGLQRAAERFEEEVLLRRAFDKEADLKFRTLVAMEQRRWVLDRVCDGWRAPQVQPGRKPYEECVDRGNVKDPKEKTHPCIARSSYEMPLCSAEYTLNNHAKWNDPDIDGDLDELDRMSVELHQRFAERTAQLRRSRPLQGKDMAMIAQQISGADETVQRAYRQLQFCLKNILDGVESYSRQYDHYHDRFEKSLSALDADVRGKIVDRLALIKKAFYPAIECNQHHDYKQTNRMLVEMIPGILTGRFYSVVAMAFEDGRRQNGRNEVVFANVASATVLGPERLCYLYYFGEDSDDALLMRKLEATLNYLGKRMARCGVTMIVACDRYADMHKVRRLQDGLEKLRNAAEGRSVGLADYRVFGCRDEEDATEQLLQAARVRGAELYDGSTRLFESQFANGEFVQAVRGSGLPYFEFDWKKKRFHASKGCRELMLIRDTSSMRISDMFALMGAEDARVRFPELAEDYRTLWNIYCGSDPEGGFAASVRAWEKMCIALEAHDASRPPLVRIPLQAGHPVQRFARLLPEFAQTTVRQILNGLIRSGAAEAGSDIQPHSLDTCALEVYTTQAVWNALRPLLDRPKLLPGYTGIDVVRMQQGGAEELHVVCDDTEVQDVCLPPEGLRILQLLYDAYFINRLEVTDGRATFEYASAPIKRLLTEAGHILQVYTYYEVLRCGDFDDAACGYEFSWAGSDVRSEVACVMTKGFRSIMLACRDPKRPLGEQYHELHSIAGQFGIGAIKVMLDGAAQADDGSEERRRGEQLSIITLSEPETLSNIGETLKNLIRNP